MIHGPVFLGVPRTRQGGGIHTSRLLYPVTLHASLLEMRTTEARTVKETGKRVKKFWSVGGAGLLHQRVPGEGRAYARKLPLRKMKEKKPQGRMPVLVLRAKPKPRTRTWYAPDPRASD